MLDIYESVRSVPMNAQKQITGGRLNGKTDINPMWRIKKLTEVFGPCGIGWRYEITDKRLEKTDSGEVAAFVDINLFYVDTKSSTWSHAIPGTGGSMFVAKEKSGLNTSDECFKMALTDAISVACKALGFGADIYWDKDSTKYDKADVQSNVITEKQRMDLVSKVKTDDEKKRFTDILSGFGYKKSNEIKPQHYDEICRKYAEYGLPFTL